MIDVLLSGVYHVRGPNQSGSQPTNSIKIRNGRVHLAPCARTVRRHTIAATPQILRRWGGGKRLGGSHTLFTRLATNAETVSADWPRHVGAPACVSGLG